MRKNLVTFLAFVAACSGDGVGGQNSNPNTLPPSADDRSSLERGNGAAYELHIIPMEGRVELTALAPPDYVSLFYGNFATATSGTGANTVTLFTDQTGVSYRTKDGTTCISNRVVIDCATLSAPCNVAGTFCAPEQLTSNFTDPLPDVVVLVANKAGQPNQVNSCSGDAAGAFGQCASQGSCSGGTGNAAKVDCGASSSLVSAISGCAYCYSNAVGAGSNDGLRDVVLPGSMPTSLSQNKLALNLANDNAFSVTGSVNYAKPLLQNSVTLSDAGLTPACATKNATTITGTGSGFGPPSGCSSSNCPASGTAGFSSAYIVDFVQSNNGTVVPAGPNSVTWSDNTISAEIDSSAQPNQSYAMRVRTPLNTTGVTTQSPAFSVCAGAGGIDHFAVSVQGNPRTGHTMTFGVVAEDVQGRRVTGYTGTITVSIDSGTLNFSGAPLYTFTSGTGGTFDNGAHTFKNGATPATTGLRTIAVTDGTHTGSVTFNVTM